jgi:hypothetical protein
MYDQYRERKDQAEVFCQRDCPASTKQLRAFALMLLSVTAQTVPACSSFILFFDGR